MFFGYVGDAERDQPERVSMTAPLRRSETPMLEAHFYAVHGSVLPRLVAFFELLLSRPAGHAEGGPMSPDAALWWFRQKYRDVPVWLGDRSLATQGSFRSDIHAPWFDRAPGLKHLAGAARSTRNWLRRKG